MPDTPKIVNLGGTIEGFPEVGNIMSDVPREISLDDMWLKGLNSVKSKGIPDIPLSSVYTGDRYPETRPGTDYEEMAAQQQSTWNKWGNSLGKFAGVGATSFVSGTVGLLNGIGSSIANWDFSKLFDNDTTRLMNRSQERLEDILPNYYAKNEKDADWWTSDNLLTANFWGDKVFKNLSYSLGALGGGIVWSKAFKLLGLTNTMVKAGAGLEAATTVEAAMTNVPKLQKFAALENALNTVGQKYIKSPAAAILKDSDRVLTSVMGTFGEASLEALQNANEFRRRAIEEYRNTNGVDPTGADLDAIDAYADKVGNYTWGLNTLLLSATNYIQLPKILGSSRRTEKALINSIEQKQLGGAWAESVAATRLGRLTDKVTGVGKYLFAPTEAFEEGAQFAIQTGANNFFERAYENKGELTSFLSAVNGVMGSVLKDGVDQTLGSKEGIESILIGGLSGGLQQIRGNIKEAKLTKTNTADALAALNKSNIDAQLKDQAKYMAIGLGSQKLRQQAIKNNDVLSEKEYENDYVLSYVMPRVKYDKTDSIYQELDSYKSQAMTETGFAELVTNGTASQNETREQFLQRINNLEALTKTVDQFYDAIDNKYSGLVDNSGNRIYSDAVIEKLVYNAAKINNYDLRIPQLNTSLLNAGVNTSDILTDIIENRMPNKEATLKALDDINKMDVTSDVKDDLKRDLSDVIELSLRRKATINEYDAIKKMPKLYDAGVEFNLGREEEPVTVEQFGVPEGKKRKKVFEKEVEVGKEYSLKNPIRREGNQLLLAPKLTVIGQNLGGEFEVRLPNGVETFLSPEQFREYELTDTSVEENVLQDMMDKSIDAVLNKKKYADIVKPTENKLQYINSLNNSELVDDIQKEFDKRSKEFLENLAKEEKIAGEKAIQEALNETSDTGVQTREIGTGKFEPDAKKTNQEVVDSTKPPVEGYSQKESLAEHHVRANRFGANFYTFANRDNFRGVIVTQGNEKQLGIPGLTQWVKDKGLAGADVDPSKTIMLVVMGIDPVTNERYFVGEDGKKLSKPTLDTIIYQTFPETLEQSGGGSMFRESTDEDTRKALTKEYMAWRENTLKSPTNDLYKINASFGSPQYVGELDQNGKFIFDRTARVAVEDSGLVSETNLRTKRVVGVPTTDGAVVYGSSTFNDVKGVPLLYSNNGLVRLNNRNLTQSEAELIYNAIERLATNLFKDKNLKSNESVMLYNWLKSVIYWGTPQDPQGNRKPAGFSSVFFGDNMLIMGKEEKKFSIKPSALKANKAAIVEELTKMYNNVNSTLVTGGQKGEWNKPYTEITSIGPDGIKTRQWQNYQSFLLSKKNPDSSARNPQTIPLTTRIRPLKDAQDTNRKGIYFTVVDKKGNTSQEVTPTKPQKKVVVPATETEAKKTEPVKKFNLEGKENVIPTKLGDFTFTINKEKFLETDGKQGILLPDPATDPEYKLMIDAAIAKLTTIPKSGITEDTPDDQAIAIAENIIRNIIRAEVKKQLTPAPEVAPAAPETEAKPAVISPNLQERVNQRKQAGPTKRGSDFRMMLVNDLKKLKPENWKNVEDWLSANFPNIPVYRVKNYILAANGRRAHGMFQDGAIYLSENAEVGTVYHEVFHAVWQALTTPAERNAFANEFRSRSGSFFDRASLKNVNYSEATDKQMEEKLAEEFRDYIQEGKVPQKPQERKSLIAKVFADIVNFFKAFFTGENAKTNTEELFKRIGSGYYKQYSPYDTALSFAKKGFIDVDEVIGGETADYNLDVFTGEQVHDLMQHMTYITVRDLFEENQGLFEITKMKRSELYQKLQDELGDLMADNVTEIEKMVTDEEVGSEEGDIMISHYNNLYKNILDNWEALVEKHEEYIRSYNIEFDENDDIDLSTLEKGKDDPYADARKIDSMRKTNSAVKLLLASLPVIQSNGSEKLSSIGGYTLLPMSEIFIGVMNNVHTSRSMTEMVNRVKAMSEDDPKYIKLYNRLSKLKTIDELDNAADLQLLSAFWRSFKKQSPTVKTVYVLDNGDIQVGDANFTTAARQVKEEFVNNIKNTIAKNSKYFKKAENGKSYIGNTDAIKKDVKLKKDDLSAQVAFLKEFGINFDEERLSTMPEKTKFAEAVNGIRTSIANGRSIMSVGGRTLDIDLRLRQLSEIKAKMDNPEFSSTYYNVNGELTQTFIGTNALNDLYNTLSQVTNLSELANTQYEYLLTDSFAANSLLLYKMFDKESGERIEGTDQLMQTAYADGTVDQKKGRQKESSKLNYKERLLQEVNLNTAGYYLNLVPGDASIEWMVYMGNSVDKSEILANYERAHTIFKGYLEDEIKLAKENRPVAKGKNSSDLRFFKGILKEDLEKTVLEFEGSIDELYAQHGKDINEAIDAFINRERDRLRNTLAEYGAIKVRDNQLVTEGLSFGKDGLTEDELKNELATLSINYAIANIELHKLLYSDPYQYSDELKRIKSFNSPRQAIISNSPEMNSAFHKVWNEGFSEEDAGYTNFDRDYFRGATVNDVNSTSDLQDYGVFEETDGGGIISLKALRNFKIRAGEWDSDQERQYKFDLAFEKQDKGEKLTGREKKIIRAGNPKVMRTYTPIKPIVSGNKANGRPYNDIVLDKFALYPFSYRVLREVNPTSNALKLYDKMQKEDVDYVVFKSGRKVGAEKTFSLYDKEGNFNEEPFETEKQKSNPMLPQTVLNIPFAIMSIQSDVPSKEENVVTRGSQMTKLVTLDFMAAGVPIDFMPEEPSFNKRYVAWNALSKDGKMGYNNGDNLYKEIKNNQDILEALVEEGVNALTTEFGLKKVDDGYEVESLEKVADALRRELTKREINDNISAALKGYKNGSVILEATPAYQQVRNVLYSIADRNVMSPKMSGSMKVQIPSTLLEGGARKVKDGVYASDVLKFYEDKDGKRVCEIMVARWFKSDLSDEELLEELKNSEILKGIGFRIPTQKQNSIDSFVIKRFLPEEYGDAVVIPSALVKKVGSDFDIDKLNLYLKNVDVNKETGEIKIIPFQGVGEEIRNRFKYRQDYKKSLENGYIESLQKLVSHPLNFENLVKPNSADQMKKLSKEIVDKLGLGSFDYNVAANMLSRRFMSRLRHAMVTGKYAIGIAAVNQTNHSLNQRTPIYIDFEGKKDLLKLQDRKFLGDGVIKFNEYNTLEVDGKTYPTISMIKNAGGDYISDILGQFIDGYVDISKDTWIMEIGATPNVASTWMFLIKVGVPIETVSYFMNQPIIRDYLREIEKTGSTWLFNDRILKKLEKNIKYKGTAMRVPAVPNNEALLDMIGKAEFNKTQKAQQRFILREFLKYAKMAEQLLIVTQGTNFDTSSFNDPFLIFKKLYQLDKARNTIFSSADDLLENSFLGKMMEGIIDVRQALSEILIADRKGTIRETIQEVLKPYVEMNDRDFIRTSQRVVSTLFDWVTQVDGNLAEKINKMMVSKETNVAKRITDFISSISSESPLSQNIIIKNLKADFADPLSKGEVNNLYLDNKTNKVYDQNQIIYGFRELKNHLKSMGKEDLYNDLLTLSVLQSGLSQSKVSFTTLLPYEDLMGIYNSSIANLPGMTSLETFKDLNVFERTYWNYDDLVPHMEAKYVVDWNTGQKDYNTNMMFRSDIYDAIKNKELPILLKVPVLAKEANYDVIVYTYEKAFTFKEKKAMRERGDYSYVKRGLFKKVGLVDNGNGGMVALYKAINAWGDGIYAKEFYNTPRKSQIDNGFIESDESITDEKILSYFGIAPTVSEEEAEEAAPEVANPSEEVPQIDYDSITDITPERKQQILTNFAKKHKLTEAKAKEYINDALKKDAKKVINKLKECY